MEANLISRPQLIPADDALPAAAPVLVHFRQFQPQWAARHLHAQVPARFHRHLPRALEPHRDPAGVGPRLQLQVVFQTPLLAVPEHIDAGIHALVAHLLVSGNVAQPAFRVAADEIVRLAGQRVESLRRRLRIGAHEPDAQLFVAQRDFHVGRTHGQPIALTAHSPARVAAGGSLKRKRKLSCHDRRPMILGGCPHQTTNAGKNHVSKQHSMHRTAPVVSKRGRQVKFDAQPGSPATLNSPIRA